MFKKGKYKLGNNDPELETKQFLLSSLREKHILKTYSKSKIQICSNVDDNNNNNPTELPLPNNTYFLLISEFTANIRALVGY